MEYNAEQKTWWSFGMECPVRLKPFKVSTQQVFNGLPHEIAQSTRVVSSVAPKSMEKALKLILDINVGFCRCFFAMQINFVAIFGV